MQEFKTLLFGVSGLSLIFWVSVIAIWHVDIFPKIFAKDSLQDFSTTKAEVTKEAPDAAMAVSGALRPNGISKGLIDRRIYSRKSLVVANFSPIEDSYSVNRLYTSILLSLSVMSFSLLCYGLQSSLRINS
tara:strand:- start:581 stop:973 length:393 start_codon:yes stop_codon:yes gene_type:complete